MSANDMDALIRRAAGYSAQSKASDVDQEAADQAFEAETSRIAAEVRRRDRLSDPEHVDLDGGARGLPIDPSTPDELGQQWLDARLQRLWDRRSR